ncbi:MULTISPECIES: hydrogenase nickel incorporation protein HypB [unclassified Clostridium]|uniref:hydrogenase nickel incorporation protein HypB n=1 Tax=Clostridium TaxID=1485 RepID=UPI001C8C76E2|nr:MULTISPECIES: hydrogenase nickel incorporation protein HypB [unclassified Clostridium]MBX9136855.1 hydrogenase nickel incorporation protein HypB [Clostridium sp. K12(2020)]MBX9143665.1 hydrogenase nickel incorporation protein HypB [Clostridium sp. K13]MDU2290091.1 hydrogenase nickel incorporation protein HypB [Clostridium celatum]MDU4324743.1 hydrogenase nickel incorporation protein HypB [Clostridium celatum]
MNIKVIKQEIDYRDECGNEIKEILKEKNIFLINVMGSPGTGKTTLIIELIKALKEKYNIAVIEGDIAGQVDAEKIDKLGIAVVQLNLNGACHIAPLSIKEILGYFDLDEIDIIFVENIGNLICPAEFDIGENLKIAILSIPEGDDKVEKYPLLFAESNILVLNKYDMMEHFDFNENKVEKDTRSINSDCSIFKVSSRTGREIDSLVKHIEDKMKEK